MDRPRLDDRLDGRTLESRWEERLDGRTLEDLPPLLDERLDGRTLEDLPPLLSDGGRTLDGLLGGRLFALLPEGGALEDLEDGRADDCRLETEVPRRPTDLCELDGLSGRAPPVLAMLILSTSPHSPPPFISKSISYSFTRSIKSLRFLALTFCKTLLCFLS